MIYVIIVSLLLQCKKENDTVNNTEETTLSTIIYEFCQIIYTISYKFVKQLKFDYCIYFHHTFK